MITTHIESITLNNGQNILLEKNQITVVVGPNNAGKSAFLKEVFGSLQSNELENKIAKSINLVKIGQSYELMEYIRSRFRCNSVSGIFQVEGQGYFDAASAEQIWNQKLPHDVNTLRSIHVLFSKILNTEERLNISKPSPSFNALESNPDNPIQYLYSNSIFEEQFSGYFKQAFGYDLIVNRAAGNIIPLHVGTKPEVENSETPWSLTYLQKLNILPTLEKQGDGMRSFVGVLLSAFVSFQNMLFIDEPEAFLHPPQAYLLGQMLASYIPSDKQLFLTTHSEDLLKGLLETKSNRLKIVRIQRANETKNIFSELSSEDIKVLWADPLLKYSNILGGLFHSKVIICESDSDCRFYSAMIDSIITGNDIKPDILFVHCGGKQRIPTVVNALVKLGVTVSVIADFDVLNNVSPLKQIFVGLGGDWALIEKEWKIVVQAIDSKKPNLNSVAVKATINAILEDVQGDIFPSKKIEEITKALKKSNPWSEAKSIGKSYVQAGEVNRQLTHVLAMCTKHKFNILEVGELECFDKSVGDHGPKWVNQVLEKDLKNDPDLEGARKFVLSILEQ